MSDSTTTNNQPSTAKALYDAAAGTVQSAYSAVVGDSTGQAAAEKKKEEAKVENDASHATVKLPGVTASSSGAVTKDDPDRRAGAWNQTIGSAKETVGGLIGHEGLKQSGRQQNLEGQSQEAKGQLSDYASGMADRAAGALGGAFASVTGDKTKQAEFQQQHDTGKTQQRGAEYDIQKQAEAAAPKPDSHNNDL